MNRVKEYYECANDYLSLPLNARFLIATHFKLIETTQMAYINGAEMDCQVFQRVAEKRIFDAFKKFVKHYKKSRSYGTDANGL